MQKFSYINHFINKIVKLIYVISLLTNIASASFFSINVNNIVTEKDASYIASIKVNGVLVCNGVFIDNKLIATVAHCVCNGTRPIEPRTISFFVKRAFVVKSIYCNPSHRNQNGESVNDFALLELNGNINVSILEVPRDLPSIDEYLTKAETSIICHDIRASWDYTRIPITLLNPLQCRKNYDVLYSTMLCSTIVDKNNCTFLPGTPIVYHKTLIGILSKTHWNKKFQVYINIGRYLKFIEYVKRETDKNSKFIH